MYQNAIYICSSWYSKFCWFPVKKCRCQQNSMGVSHDSYIFWVFFTEGITAKFHHCGICVTHFREGCFLSQPPSSPHICEQPQKSPSWIGLLWCNFYNGILECSKIIDETDLATTRRLKVLGNFAKYMKVSCFIFLCYI